MDKVKINAAVDALSISLDHRNIIKEALNEGAGDGMQELETKVDNIDKEVGAVSTDVTTIKSNIEEINTKVTTNSKNISTNADLYKQVDGKVKTLTDKVDNLNIPSPIIDLTIGDSNEIKAANLAKLGDTQHTFFASINYGFGAASWLPTDGGNSFVTTDEGHAVIYKIAKDGAVTKQSEFTISAPISYTLPKATKEAIGGVKAITNIADIDAESATIASLAGVINTLLAQMRTADIIQL